MLTPSPFGPAAAMAHPNAQDCLADARGRQPGDVRPFTVDRRRPHANARSCVGNGTLLAPYHAMIRKLSSGEYRLYSRKRDPRTGTRRNLGTFKTRAAAEKHERAVQFFKRR